jgi:hypothetical protein
MAGVMERLNAPAEAVKETLTTVKEAVDGINQSLIQAYETNLPTTTEAIHEFIAGVEEDLAMMQEQHPDKTMGEALLGDEETAENIAKKYEEVGPRIAKSVDLLSGAFGKVRTGMEALGVKGGGGFGKAMAQVGKVQAIISAAQTIRELAEAAAAVARYDFPSAVAHLAAAAGYVQAESAGKKAQTELGAASGGITQKKATGGIVTGPAGIDNIPVMATAGEGVLTAQTTKSILSELTGQAAAPAVGGATNNFYFNVEGDALDPDALVAKTIPALEKAMAEQTLSLQPALAR